MKRRRLLVPVLAHLSAVTAACVLPDKEIEFEDSAISNRNAVRLVEPTILTEEAEEACDPNDEDMLSVPCPQPGGLDFADVRPHFLDPDYTTRDEFENASIKPYAFCICPEGQRDSKALDYTLYVEDQDEKTSSREPKDTIYAALLLDLPQSTTRPNLYVDYTRYVDPDRQLEFSDDEYKPLRRRDPQLRQLTLGNDQDPLDLCNGADREMTPGYHSLTVMVTDRKWFQPDIGVQQWGVPDLAAGATFDTMTYVFKCDQAPDNDDMHACRTSCVKPGQETP